MAAAAERGRVLYAVPGSPVVAERTVELLVADDRVAVELVPALSFVDLAWVRLGVDPLDGVRLVDGHRFAAEAAGERGPLLVGQCDDRDVLSEVKLAIGGAVDAGELAASAGATSGPDEPTVVVLQRLGLPDESVVEVAWHELDRVVAPTTSPRCTCPPGGPDRRRGGGVRPGRAAAAGRLPVGSRADPPQPAPPPAGGGVRGARGARPPGRRRGRGLRRPRGGAGRPAVPGGVPLGAGRRGGASPWPTWPGASPPSWSTATPTCSPAPGSPTPTSWPCSGSRPRWPRRAGPASWTASRSPALLLYASKVQRKAESQGVDWRALVAGDADLSATGRRLLDAVDAARRAGDDAESEPAHRRRAAWRDRYRAQEDPAV